MAPRAEAPDPAYQPGIAGVASIKAKPQRWRVNMNGIPDTSMSGAVMLQQPTRWSHDFDPDTGNSRASLITETPLFDNHPQAPTPPIGSSDASLATTEFVSNAGAGTVAEAVMRSREGAVDGFNARPGDIGEYLAYTVPPPGVELTSAQVTVIGQLELPAGDWDVSATGCWSIPSVGNTAITYICAISDTTTFPGFPNFGGVASTVMPLSQIDTALNCGLRMLTATPKIMFLLGYCSFVAGRMWSYGFIGARRRR